jgi:hypothetical protein
MGWKGFRTKIAGAICAAVLSFPVMRAEAALVAPHALFMNHETRSGVFYVHNPSDVPIEVDVDLVFGYPVSDDEGRVRVVYFPDADPDAPSAARWTRALPRRVVVPPGQRQAVRLLSRPPAGLPDGEYWSRILVRSQAQQIESSEVGQGSGLRVGLRAVTRTVTSLNYRKGELRTAVVLRRFDHWNLGDKLVAEVDLERRGNAAFLGRLQLSLVDQAGEVAYDFDHGIAVYYDLLRHIEIPLDGLDAGEYSLRLRISTDRTDISQQDVLAAAPIEESVQLYLGAVNGR